LRRRKRRKRRRSQRWMRRSQWKRIILILTNLLKKLTVKRAWKLWLRTIVTMKRWEKKIMDLMMAK
jgi:hypothetical protein